MHLQALDYVLWVITPLVQLCIIYFLRKRGLVSEFPIFYAYNILQIATGIFLIVVERLSYTVYFYSYWIAVAATVLLTFALIDELFRLAFHSYDALQSVGSRIFRWILLLMFLGACGLVFTLPHIRGSSTFGELILLTDRCARIMLCLWAVLLIIGSPLMRISRRSMLFGIAVGVVISALSKILIDTLYLDPAGPYQVSSRINTTMYLGSCVLWALYAAYGEGLPRYEALPGAIEPPQPGDDEDDGRRPLMELINETVDRYLRNPS